MTVDMPSRGSALPSSHLPSKDEPSFLEGLLDTQRFSRVHSRVFTDSDIFELELLRIFYRTWVYIGHESEVPVVGDHRLRMIGRQPVIMVRSSESAVDVLFNRCRHRGSLVAVEDCTRVRRFHCPWHGWTYALDGRLTGISSPKAYPDGMLREIGGLSRPARLDNYRGFVFASLEPAGLALSEYLGPAARMIDYLMDASPVGRIRMTSGSSKTTYRGNWKFVGMDGYHGPFVHASVTKAWQEKAASGLGTTHRGKPYLDNSQSRTRDLGHGHAMLDLRRQRLDHSDAHLELLEMAEGGRAYIEAMHARHGEARARELLSVAGDPHVGIFPNMQIINNHVRIINPVTVDQTDVVMIPVMLEGVDPALNRSRLRQHESFYGPSGAGSPDDAEVFERAQRGLHAAYDPWVLISRGLDREEVDEEGIVGLITDEVPQRGQMKEWFRLMSSEPPLSMAQDEEGAACLPSQ